MSDRAQSLKMLRVSGVLDPPPRFSMRMVLLMAVLGGATVAVALTPFGYLLPAAILCIAYVPWSFRRPRVALASIILFSLHILERSEGISLLEIGFALYFFGYLAYWFTGAALVRREQIIRSTTDRFLVAFLALCVGSIVIILAEGGSPLLWLRECITLANLLLYFPARDVMRRERDQRIIMGVFFGMVTIVAVTNLVNYRAASLAAAYLWEMVASRAPFGSHYFVLVVVVALSLSAHLADRRTKIFLAGAALLAGGALAVTFSRAFWIGAVIACGLLFMVSDSRRRWSLIRTSMLLAGTSTVFVFLFAGSAAAFLLDALISRLMTSGTPLADISVTNRIAESGDAITAILASPLIGHGIGGTFVTYDLIYQWTAQTAYVHNAFLLLLLKVGILGTLIFFGFYFGVIGRGITLSRRVDLTPFMAGSIRGIVAVLLVFLVIGLSSGIWVNKEALLIIALGSAVVMAAPAPGGRRGDRSPGVPR